MQEKGKSTSLLTLDTFGDLLKYLRKRAQLTQRELAIAVGYTESHITRLEKNQRPPDLATVAALFVPALGLEDEPETAAQLMELAGSARGGQVAGKQGQPQRAARLFGAAQALRDQLGTPQIPIEQADYERNLEAVHTALGDEAFLTAWAEGQAMLANGLDNVVEYAMDSN